LFDEISQREAPYYSMKGHMPAKWSYEAILDLKDSHAKLETELAQAQATIAELRERLGTLGNQAVSDRVAKESAERDWRAMALELSALRLGSCGSAISAATMEIVNRRREPQP
jgi:hypothetical protein